MATDLVSVFSGSVPFSSRFPLHIWENLSISSSILKITSKHVQHVPYFMLFYVVLRYIFISVPHTASTVPSSLFFYGPENKCNNLLLLHVFESNDSNPLFHEEQLPAD